MARHCETFDHTADVGLAARADSLGELLEALAEGLAEVICAREQVAAVQKRAVAAAAEDVEALAVDFLSAVLAAVQTGRFVVAAVRVTRIDEGSPAVEAELAGEPYQPSRHELKTEVKAVTYHQLTIARAADGWTARVILDI